MPTTQTLIEDLYAAFNRRDIDAALALMTDNVDWPKASEGGRVIGREAIRAYWTRQWQEFIPRVDPLEVTDRAPDEVAVKVQQHVTTLSGELLFDGVIWHIYQLTNDLIQRMDIQDAAPWPNRG